MLKQRLYGVNSKYADKQQEYGLYNLAVCRARGEALGFHSRLDLSFIDSCLGFSYNPVE